MRLRIYWMREMGMADDEIIENCRAIPIMDIDEEVRNVLALKRIAIYNGVEIVPFPDHIQTDLQKVYEIRRKNKRQNILIKIGWLITILMIVCLVLLSNRL